jgi:hypothetical protein
MDEAHHSRDCEQLVNDQLKSMKSQVGVKYEDTLDDGANLVAFHRKVYEQCARTVRKDWKRSHKLEHRRAKHLGDDTDSDGPEYKKWVGEVTLPSSLGSKTTTSVFGNFAEDVESDIAIHGSPDEDGTVSEDNGVEEILDDDERDLD